MKRSKVFILSIVLILFAPVAAIILLFGAKQTVNSAKNVINDNESEIQKLECENNRLKELIINSNSNQGEAINQLKEIIKDSKLKQTIKNEIQNEIKYN